jgi:hypothetical protein
MALLHTKEANRKTELSAHHHQECILDNIRHTVNVGSKLCIIEALDGASTNIFVEMSTGLVFPNWVYILIVEKPNLEPIQHQYEST